MLLPCPHCRRQFKLATEQIGAQRAKIKCPGCEGLFLVNLGPVQDADCSLGMQTAPARHGPERNKPKYLMFWALVPGFCLLLALTAILLSGPWLRTNAPKAQSPRAEIGTEDSLISSVSSRPEGSAHHKDLHSETSPGPATPGQHPETSIVEAFWSSPSPDPKAPCAVLNRSQAEWLAKEDPDPCQLYPLWITYLLLDTSPTPVCALEPPFALAMDAIQSHSLCGPGHAFLSAYYLGKRLLERSQSYLEEALRLAPDDPWVQLVEAVFYEEVTYDDQKAIHILEELNRRHPSFPLARYLLGKTYIREEEYGKASTSFESLREDVKGQVAFWRIRRALSSLEQAPEQSVAKAEALLALSRAFTALKDYPMAQHLYHWILEEMPGRLPEKERMAAYCELGRIYETGGDSNSAYDSYRSALEIDPEFPDAREGIRNLLPHQSNQS